MGIHCTDFFKFAVCLKVKKKKKREKLIIGVIRNIGFESQFLLISCRTQG